MTKTPYRSGTAACLTLAVAMAIVQSTALAADCLGEVEKTTAQMQSSAKLSDQDHGNTDNPPNPPDETWQGGSQRDGSTDSQSPQPAENPEANKWLRIASQLAKTGKAGGCWQTLVQAKRILGLIPADTPLPDVPPG